MALQTSGQISISDIQTELSNSSGSLTALSVAASKTAPHGMKEFYGFSAGPAYNNTQYYQNDGTGDYIDCTTSTAPFNINTTQDLSFSMWVRQTGNKQNQLLFNFGNTNANGNNRIFLSYSANLNRFVFRYRSNSVNFDRQWALHGGTNETISGVTSSSTGWTSSSRGNVNSDDFCLITVTYDASQSTATSAMKFYWNASEMPTQAAANNGTRTAMSATKGRIGENLHLTNSAGNATLDYDEIKIFNKVLSSSEVTSLYNSGSIADSTQTVSSGLITEWTFDDNTVDDSNSEYTCTKVNGVISSY